MSTNLKICNICDYRHVTKPATDWCSECEQSFCNECKEFHGFSRSSQNHATIPISDFLALETSFLSITSLCTEHNEIYNLVCQTHDQLLCLRCIKNHKDCKGIVPLSEITKNVKSSTCFQETQTGFTDTNENITKIRDELKLSLETINDEEKLLMSEIGTMRKKIDDHVDKLENNLKKELSKEATESRTAIEVLLQKLDDRKTETTKHLRQMKDLESYASDFQTYISLRQISSAVDSAESFVQSVAKDGNLEIDAFSLNFDEKINEMVSNIQQFGMVHIQKKVCHVTLIRQKDKQAQLVGLERPQIKSVNEINLKLFQTIDTKCDFIRGCEILSDGKMVFGNSSKDSYVVIFDSEGKRLLNTLKKQGRPCMDITCIDKNTKLAISSGYRSQCTVNIVDISKPEIESKCITMKNYCYGVTCTDNSLLCYISKEGIQKISLDNYKVSTIIKSGLHYGYVAVHNNKLYYTDRDKNSVTCSDMESQLVWTFRDETVLKDPLGITVDTCGFVYVVSHAMNSVVVLSPDGQEKKVLLTNINGLKTPCALNYDKLRNRLLVANSERTAYLFDVSK
ncbi:uncharacterized protein LOC127716188 [Mytilus californianus]|uniref:uncharacterized protein LOC127716188 n=1 Tax=Mytilus californianus TaxID=6549 RepID=UPI0022469BC0|nr:uncharacterized protein LOC127716188 [Mytilus californianus]